MLDAPQSGERVATGAGGVAGGGGDSILVTLPKLTVKGARAGKGPGGKGVAGDTYTRVSTVRARARALECHTVVPKVVVIRRAVGVDERLRLVQVKVDV